MTLAALAAAVDAAADAPLDGALDHIRPFLADIGWFQAWMTQQTSCMRADPLHLP